MCNLKLTVNVQLAAEVIYIFLRPILFDTLIPAHLIIWDKSTTRLRPQALISTFDWTLSKQTARAKKLPELNEKIVLRTSISE